jgi:membrane-bound serine protease (ClpP class)
MALHTLRRCVGVVAITLGLAVGLVGAGAAQDEPGAVHIVPITGEIDLGIAPFLDRALSEADEAGAAAVVLEIDTPGGRLDAVLQMRDALLASPVPTVAHVNPTAFSAGALVALAAEQIYFAPAGVMGAATPVVGTAAGGAETADPKVVSSVSSTFRATAEERGRDPLVGEAMVDPSLEVEGVSSAGSLLTLTASDAAEVGYSDGVATDRDDLLAQLGLADAAVVEASPTLAERTVRFITSPIVASLLVAVGLLLIVGELLAGAFGLAGLAGAGLIGTFLWGHLLAGLAGWEDVTLIGVGVVLLLVEIFVVPGVGVPGVLGLASIVGGTYMAMVGRDFDFVSSDRLWATAGTVGLTFIGIGVGLIALLALLSRRRSTRDERDAELVHAGTVEGDTMTDEATGKPDPNRPRFAGPPSDGQDSGGQDSGGQDSGGQSSGGQDSGAKPSGRARRRLATPRPVAGDARDRRGWLKWFGDGDILDRESDETDTTAQPTPSTAARQGAIGIALTDLRPAGVANFDGHRIDVVTEGDYLAAGEHVEVLRAERYRRVVRRAADDDPVPS